MTHLDARRYANSLQDAVRQPDNMSQRAAHSIRSDRALTTSDNCD